VRSALEFYKTAPIVSIVVDHTIWRYKI